MRLRTAKAGLGRPCAEVALCTPPDIGVLKRPALVPLPDGAVRDASTFKRSFAFFSLLCVKFSSPLRKQEVPS